MSTISERQRHDQHEADHVPVPLPLAAMPAARLPSAESIQ
jgi:hypothetical protein